MSDAAKLVAEVEAILAKRTVAPSSSASTPSAQLCGGFQEAAAVLISFQIDKLKPVPGAPAADTLETLIALSAPSDYVEGSSRLWSLRPEPRIAALRQLRTTTRVQAALDATPDRRRDPVQETFEAYLNGTAKPVEQQTLVEITALQQVADWLREAGFTVPSLAALQQRAEWLKLLQPFEHIAGNFFRGRKDEIARLRSYVGIVPPGSLETLRRAVVEAFVDRTPLLIYGPGGVGKSTLASRFILEHARALESERFPFAYLDFDRPEINAAQPLTLLIEAVRQIGTEYPESRERCERIRQVWLQMFRNNTSADANATSSQSISARALPGAIPDFAALIASIAPNRPVVIVLDTFEEVQYRSDEHVANVWSLFEQLHRLVNRLCLIIVGRATIPGRPTEDLELQRFDNEAAIGYLQARGVTDLQLATQIAKQVGGNPMNLHLAADLAVRDNIKTGSDLGISTRNAFFLRLDDANVQRQLYNRVLDHIHDDRVVKLARPGLVLHRITPELIFEVLNVPCGLKLQSMTEAEDLFQELRREKALVRIDSDGSLIHRPELRAQTLAMLCKDEPQTAADIHQAAVNYYEKRPPTPSERAEEIYHRLSLCQDFSIVTGRWIEGVEPYLQDTFDEFSGTIRAYLAPRLGREVDEQTRNLADLQDWEDIVKRKVNDMLEVGQNQTALDLLGDRTDRSPQSALYAMEATALWRLGRAPEAFAVLDRGIQASLTAGARLPVLRLLLQAADMVISSRRAYVPEWLVPTIQAFPESGLSAEDRIALLARKIALANIDFPFRADPSINIDGNLRREFDGLSDADLARRPEVSWWAATTFGSADLPRLKRVLTFAGVPRTGAEQELRDLAARIASFDVDVSKQAGESPGLLARAFGITVVSSLTATWSTCILTSEPHRVQEALLGILGESRLPIPQEIFNAFQNLMRAGVGVAPPRIDVTQTRVQSGGANISNATRRLDTRTQKVLLESLRRCYPNMESLDSFLRLRLAWSLDSITRRDSLDSMVLRVIQWAQAQGQVVELVEAARNSNPQDPGLNEVAYGLGVSTLAGSAAKLEKIVANSALIDVAQWRAQLNLLEGRVCRVEAKADTTNYATGFLVGPDLILTVSHVLPRNLNLGTPVDLQFRFDYKRTEERVLSEGTIFNAAHDWLVTQSPPGDPDAPGDPTRLDYALLRASNSPGAQPIGGAQAESSGAFRGWVALPPPAELSLGEMMFLVHHPDAGPLQFSAGHLTALRDPIVEYDLATQPGSAGAPCFRGDFRLAALHVGRTQQMHYGTLMSSIIRDLTTKGFGYLLGSTLA